MRIVFLPNIDNDTKTYCPARGFATGWLGGNAALPGGSFVLFYLR